MPQLSNLFDWLIQFATPWWTWLCYPNPTKCCLVVGRAFVSQAMVLFADLGIKIVTSHHFLGGFIGDSIQRRFRSEFLLFEIFQKLQFYNLKQLMLLWPDHCKCDFQPVISDCAFLFTPLKHILLTHFVNSYCKCHPIWTWKSQIDAV